MPHRWLFIKQASRLGSLSLKSHVQVPDADIPQAAFRLTGQECTAFAGNGQVIECNVPDGSCLCPAVFPGGRTDENRFALSPPARCTRLGIAVCIAQGGSGQVVNMDILHRSSIAYPDTHRTGATVNNAVA